MKKMIKNALNKAKEWITSGGYILLFCAMLMSLFAIVCIVSEDRWLRLKENPPTNADEILEFNKNSPIIDSGNIIYTDGVLTAKLSKEAGVLTFSGHGAIEKHEKWAIREDEKKYIHTIVFENGIMSIGNSEFSRYSGYYNLEKLVFEGDINFIGMCAFSGASNLKEVEFRGNCLCIEMLAFFECYSLQKINIPEECNIHPWAFSETPYEVTYETEEEEKNGEEAVGL